MAQDYAEKGGILGLFEASINGSIVAQDFLLRHRQTISSHRSGIRKSLLDLPHPTKPGGLIPTTQLARTAHFPLPCSFLRVSYPGKHSKTCGQNLLLSRACEIPRETPPLLAAPQ